jgi:uncharacterized protein (DUF1697 family)
MGKFVALLRGINVGGNKKVPMADLKKVLESMGFKNVKTLLITSNAVFEGAKADSGKISRELEKKFKFPIHTIVHEFSIIEEMSKANYFKNIKVTPDIRLYVTFVSEKPKTKATYNSPDGSFHIIKVTDNAIFSYLDISKAKTPQAMNILEKTYGNNITTRNWNTVVKISKM